MVLPAEFQFSQASLQDFVDCRRRFQLRYLRQLAWPAVEAEPVQEHERFVQQGERFHRLAQQYLIGIPPARLEAMVDNPDLQGWWQNFLQFTSALLEAQPESLRYPEVSLVAELGGYTLAAKCDLVLAARDGKMLILDWKTARRKPERVHLAQRLQTRVYPYLLVRAGAHLNSGQEIQPDQVEMTYWFASQPTQPERFTYSTAQFQADQDYLSGLIAEIASLGEADYPLTEVRQRSLFCVYRSLCERGVAAGELSALESQVGLAEAADLPALDFDFEQIAEVEF